MPDMNLNHDPEPSGSWLTCMQKGNFEDAWKFSDIALAEGVNRDYDSLPRHLQNIWNGTPLNGKRVLVRCYHGLGDTIQFIRYAPLLKRIAAEVIVWAQPVLIDLLKSVSGIDQLLPLHDGVPEVEYDVDIEVMELPFIFRSSIETIPSTIPYLHVEPLKTSATNKNLTVGLSWHPSNWAPERSIPFPLLKDLMQIPGVDILILQADAPAAGWEEGYGIHPGEFDLYNYARTIKGLDLMITIDSMQAHLAGALDVPVWTLLRKNADWRWMENRNDSPWYPSMKLFRQTEEGDWTSVIDTVASELKKVAYNRP